MKNDAREQFLLSPTLGWKGHRNRRISESAVDANLRFLYRVKMFKGLRQNRTQARMKIVETGRARHDLVISFAMLR